MRGGFVDIYMSRTWENTLTETRKLWFCNWISAVTPDLLPEISAYLTYTPHGQKQL